MRHLLVIPLLLLPACASVDRHSAPALPLSFAYHLLGHEDGADGGTVADVNGDGKLDIVVANEEDCSIVLYVQHSPEHWSRRQVAGGYSGPEDAVVSDFDGDGLPDIAFVGDEAENQCANDARVAVAYQNPDETWTTHPLVDGLGAINLVTADIDSDGDADIIYADKAGNRIVALLNPGVRQAYWTETVLAEGEGTRGAFAAVLADMDGDGDLDLISTARGSNAVFWLERPENWTEPWVRHEIGTVVDPVFVEASDIDQDGDVDVVVAGWRGNEIAIFENGAGWQKHSISSRAHPIGLAVADFNGDGILDIAATTYATQKGPGQVLLLTRKGSLNGPWTEEILYTGLAAADEIMLLHFAGDTTPSIVTTSNDFPGGRVFYLRSRP